MDLEHLIMNLDLAGIHNRLIIDPETFTSGDAMLNNALQAITLAAKERIRTDNQARERAGRNPIYSELTPDQLSVKTPTALLLEKAIRQAHAETRFAGVTPADQPPQPVEPQPQRLTLGMDVQLVGGTDDMHDMFLPEGIIEDYLNGDEIIGVIEDIDDQNYLVALTDYDTYWIRPANLEPLQ